VSAAPRHAPSRPSRPRGRDGFIIVAVLWILMALATLVSVYSIYVGNSALALAAMDDGVQIEALVRTGVELTVYRLTMPVSGTRPTSGAFRFRLGAANAAVTYRPENARVDLNVASKDMLAGLFAALGASSEQADWSADRIIGWRAPPKRGNEGAEDQLYRSASLPYLPRGAPFGHLSELWLVNGLSPALITRALPFVTIYSGEEQINVFDAPPEVVAALPGMSPARLNAFLNKRETVPHDADGLALALGTDVQGATADAGKTMRVRVQIAFDNGRKTASEVVIVTGSDGEPYRVLSWRDDVDAAPDQPQTATRLR
jgi:general secretion pathway protein K